ncbi:MAG: hypothetical protein FJW30_12590 [Acidobacteria bacterium]|nr:hypothetical protein [Acidobacteriota bacterium]
MAKVLPWILIGGFGAVLASLLGVSMARSDVYPEWSTMRSDPLGAKVLFEALRRTAPDVRRNYEDLSAVQPGKGLYVFLGVSPLVFSDPKRLQFAEDSSSEVLLALAPPARKSNLRTEKFGFLQTPDGLLLRSDAWECLDGQRDGCRVARKGRVRLLSDGTPLTNRSLREARDVEFISGLFRTELPVIFDESHLGVVESGGVGVLLRKYRLFPAIALLLALALLYVWRNSTTLAPAREPVSEAMTPQPAASLRTLLAQSVPKDKLAETLAAEWTRALHLLPGWQAGRRDDLEAATRWAKDQKDPNLGYESMRAALRPRRERL